MKLRDIALCLLALILAGCGDIAVSPPPQAPLRQTTPQPPKVSASRAASNFKAVVARMEPVAERECRARTRGRRVNCDFRIVVDNRRGLPPNAFQTIDRRGRPVIGFTEALLRDARNRDELAFILGHEASHHIRGHIPKAQQTAQVGAVLGGALAAALGANDAVVQTAQQIGGTVGGRRFSKKFELEADQLGTVITVLSGYDPIRGAAFFTRIPDPGDRFLGSHPPNAARITTVRQTVANMR